MDYMLNSYNWIYS